MRLITELHYNRASSPYKTTVANRHNVVTGPQYNACQRPFRSAAPTGVKTSNGRISTTARTDRDLKTILEIARERGMRTGDVTPAELTDATPAALASHVASRTCQGPTDLVQ